jgi:hypothetical protein
MLVTLGGRNTKVMLPNSKVEKPRDLPTLVELTTCEDALFYTSNPDYH